MDTEIAAIIDRLRESRRLDILRVIEAADLDGTVEADPDAATVVKPYTWLLDATADGVQLTGAGYLPPKFVVKALAEIGWADRTWGQGNRENNTPKLLAFRRSAQRSGLLRNHRGVVAPTKLGEQLRHDPVGLWWHLAGSTIARKGVEQVAGLLYVLAVAAGQKPSGRWMSEGLATLGWFTEDGGLVDGPSALAIGSRNVRVLDALDLKPDLYGPLKGEPIQPSVVRFARAVLVGQPKRRVAAVPDFPNRDATPQLATVVQLTVTLQDSSPPIWRRLLVPASLTLAGLHDVIQTAMGWEGYHLHDFDIGGIRFGDPDELEDERATDENTFTLDQIAKVSKDFRYEYDFGDGWKHEIHIEQISDVDGPVIPKVVDGARACPPEDCGGIGGFANLLDVLADPTDEQYDDLRRWLGGPFDPDAWDVAETNVNLDLIDRQTRRRRG